MHAFVGGGMNVFNGHKYISNMAVSMKVNQDNKIPDPAQPATLQ